MPRGGKGKGAKRKRSSSEENSQNADDDSSQSDDGQPPSSKKKRNQVKTVECFNMDGSPRIYVPVNENPVHKGQFHAADLRDAIADYYKSKNYTGDLSSIKIYRHSKKNPDEIKDGPLKETQFYFSLGAATTHPITYLEQQKIKHEPSKWFLSYPLFNNKLPPPVNLKVLIGTKDGHGFAGAQNACEKALVDAGGSKGTLLVGLQAGMGIGKSYAVDIADQLFFAGENPIVLKVTYNFNQNLGFEGKQENAGKGFLARVALALLQTVPPDSYNIVATAIQQDTKNELTAQNVANWIRNQKGVGNRPIIFTIDEIGSLLNLASIQAILSVVADLIQKLWTLSNSEQKSLSLITALPQTDLTSLSKRQPFIIKPIAFSNEESDAFLKSQSPK